MDSTVKATVTSCTLLSTETVTSTIFNTATTTCSYYSQIYQDITTPPICSTTVASADDVDTNVPAAGFFALALLLMVLLVLSVSVNIILLVKKRRY